MKKHLLTLLIVVTCACNYDEPFEQTEYELNYDNSKEAAISAWEMQIGWVSDRCLQHLDGVVIHESDNIKDDCYSRVEGCMLTNSNLIFVDIYKYNLDKLKIVTHEYIHHIETCEYSLNYYNNPSIQFSNRNESHYNNKIWGYQENSVENISKQIVEELSVL